MLLGGDTFKLFSFQKLLDALAKSRGSSGKELPRSERAVIWSQEVDISWCLVSIVPSHPHSRHVALCRRAAAG